MTEIVNVVVLGNDEAVMLRHPADDGAVNFSDDGTFIASQLFVGFRLGYYSCDAIRAGVYESSPLLSIGDVGDEIVFLTRSLEGFLQGIVIVCCDNERKDLGSVENGLEW